MKVADRVNETTTTTGTGTYSLAGAQTGYRAFSSAFATGDLVYYCVENGVDWEVGRGTLTSGSPWTLARTTILASSNAGAAVNWGGGDKNVFCTAPAQLGNDRALKAWVNFNGAGTVAIRSSFNVTSITDGGTGDYTVNFTVPFPDANHCPVVTGGSNDGALYTIVADNVVQTSSSARIKTAAFNVASPWLYDATVITVQVSR